MKQTLDKISESMNYIMTKIKQPPKIAIILGSGLGDLVNHIENKVEIPYDTIPHFPKTTVEGHKGQLIYGSLGNKTIIAMQGRFHFYEGYLMEQVTYPIRVLKKIGIEILIVSNAAGCVNEKYHQGELMIITDHINMMGTNPLIGPNFREFGTRFPDMSEAYDRKLISIAKDEAKKINCVIREGIYMGFTGPSYETPAEVRMARLLGADAVGMSTVPEVIVANHSGIKVLGISCLTNMAAGILDQPLCHEEVIESSNIIKNVFVSLVENIVTAL